MARGGKQRGTRAERERTRIYQARRSFHEGLSRRRVRDNLIAGIGGGVLLVAILIGQTLYYTGGPGAPLPSPSATPGSSPSGTPAPSEPAPSQTPAPAPSPTASE